MIGRPIVVDEIALIRLGPMRMLFACRNLATLRGYVHLWFNGEGYDIKLEPKLHQLRRGVQPPPRPPPSNGQGPDGKDKDQDESMVNESIDTPAWDQLGMQDKDKTDGTSSGKGVCGVDAVVLSAGMSVMGIPP
ncbi:hypothetical protein ZWY2020_032749 [Hordeum vulgare]|nr:hypothetical protein ZWY2020_032749 [Hordeum vulgare]